MDKSCIIPYKDVQRAARYVTNHKIRNADNIVFDYNKKEILIIDDIGNVITIPMT